MTIDTKMTIDQEYIRSFSNKNHEPEWFAQLRSQALEKAEDLPMPKPDKTRITNWNFTDFAKHEAEGSKFESLADLPEVAKSVVHVDEDNQNLYVQHNQKLAYLSLSDELKKQGVIFTDLFTALQEHGDLVKKYFMTDAVKIDEHKLTAFHAALVNGGAFLYVPKNVEVKEPIQAVYILDDKEAAVFNHVIVVADDNSSVTYVENYLSTNEEVNGIVNVVSEVFANANAKVVYGAVDTIAKGSTVYVNRRGITGRDAELDWALGMMNDGNTISENTTNLIGQGSKGDAKTVVVGRGKQTQNFTTSVIHFGRNTEGFILNHGVMKDAASSIFNGIGKIEKGASKANAEQESRVLMLSEKARGDANPILLIDEDDVMAGHAASVGRVDPMQLFYMMSRGISKTDAERLIIHGFLAPVVEKLPIEAVKSQLTEIIERKMR
ncbi:FeS cluster assembly protein SufD [Siminovitchia terrae]|uniref:Fe-S cluster assembly protein SufD n=1 Tax=Siminovitchia terrae TaxID=1914933 RepID=A0A429X6W6_SIMTE|nr:Fe-S cluster assembly protein SufD [Siminovitchia terrae]RST58943.1 Fe-S cluster assembly protein SufD [Siminovitchia terrae]GIN89034.1 FeS cluster assembly protein SufD [Siminovitchia terrae]GIN95102.1 FeS cluster assembly protein SufD [Siminovitchia terrae]